MVYVIQVCWQFARRIRMGLYSDPARNQLGALISQIYFWKETLHVSYISSVHHQELFTVHTAMVYVIQVFWHLVHWKTPDEGQRNCPKHVEFHSKKLIWEIGSSIWFYYKNNTVHLLLCEMWFRHSCSADSRSAVSVSDGNYKRSPNYDKINL
jgi:hypothetical protein